MKSSSFRTAAVGPCAVLVLAGCSAPLNESAPERTLSASPSESVEDAALPSLDFVTVPEPFARVDEDEVTGGRVVLRSSECDVVVHEDAEPHAGGGLPREMSQEAVEEWRGSGGGTEASDAADVLVPLDGEPTASEAPDSGVNFVSRSWTESGDGVDRRVRAAARVSVVPSFSGELTAQTLGWVMRCQAEDIDEVLWESVVLNARPDIWVPAPETLNEWAGADPGEATA